MPTAGWTPGTLVHTALAGQTVGCTQEGRREEKNGREQEGEKEEKGVDK